MAMYTWLSLLHGTNLLEYMLSSGTLYVPTLLKKSFYFITRKFCHIYSFIKNVIKDIYNN